MNISSYGPLVTPLPQIYVTLTALFSSTRQQSDRASISAPSLNTEAQKHPQRSHMINIHEFYLPLPTGTIGRRAYVRKHPRAQVQSDTQTLHNVRGSSVDVSACFRHGDTEHNPLWWNLKVPLASSVAGTTCLAATQHLTCILRALEWKRKLKKNK